MIASAPCSATTPRKRSAISVSALSHDTGSNRPLPFGPLRRNGVVIRSEW